MWADVSSGTASFGWPRTHLAGLDPQPNYHLHLANPALGTTSTSLILITTGPDLTSLFRATLALSTDTTFIPSTAYRNPCIADALAHSPLLSRLPELAPGPSRCLCAVEQSLCSGS